MRFSPWAMPFFWGLSHALADATTGFWLFSQGEFAEMALLFFLFNLVGFALQPLLGLWVDRWQSPHFGAALSLAFLATALWFFPVLPQRALWGCVLLLGGASALFHVSVGSLSLNSPQPLQSSALFAAPGVLGLSVGTWAALQGWSLAGPLSLALSFASVLWFCSKSFDKSAKILGASGNVLSEKQEFLLLGLVLAIALRSYFWNRYQLLSPGTWLLWLGCAACAGKLAGGLLAQQFGIRRVVWPGMILALFCLLLPSPPLWLTCLGVAVLQSSSPLTLNALGQLLPGRRALAAGLALGFGLALGGLPLLIDLSLHLPLRLPAF
jgi:hypothetical protein